MANDSYAEKLDWFKQNERPEIVLLIANDLEMMNIVLAWANIKIGRKENPTTLNDPSESGSWEWLWKNTVFSRQELQAKSHSPAYGFDRKIDFLIGNRVLYPDGTVNSFVERFLRERVIKLFGENVRRR